jgi:hypothetical protein
MNGDGNDGYDINNPPLPPGLSELNFGGHVSQPPPPPSGATISPLAQILGQQIQSVLSQSVAAGRPLTPQEAMDHVLSNAVEQVNADPNLIARLIGGAPPPAPTHGQPLPRTLEENGARLGVESAPRHGPGEERAARPRAKELDVNRLYFTHARVLHGALRRFDDVVEDAHSNMELSIIYHYDESGDPVISGEITVSVVPEGSTDIQTVQLATWDDVSPQDLGDALDDNMIVAAENLRNLVG